MFTKLLIPLDGSPRAERAIAVAASIARAAKAAIDVVMVHEPLPFAGFGSVSQEAKQTTTQERYLMRTASEAQHRFSVPTTHAMLHGSAVDMICGRAREGADLIVMTSHGRTGLSRALLGSVADEVLRQSSVPVLIVRPSDEEVAHRGPVQIYHRILVPLDGSVVALAILPAVAALAQGFGAAIDLIHVVPRVPAATSGAARNSGSQSRFEEDVQATKGLTFEARHTLGEAARMLETLGVPHVEYHVVVSDDPVREILEAVRTYQSSAIAMSTQGRGASRLLVGSVADRIIRGSSLPMLLCRPVGVTAGAHFVTTRNVEEQLPALSPPESRS